jgi:hypothetical protein
MTRAQRTNAALAEIATERARQVNVEGWTEQHDDEHDNCEMAAAAAAYGLAYAMPQDEAPHPPEWWPWDPKWWKPADHRRNLVKAGALIVAEIERLDRLAGL